MCPGVLLCTRCYPEVPEILLPHLNHLSDFLFASIPFDVVPFCIDKVIPVGFPWSEVLLEVILLQHLHHVLWFNLDLLSAVQMLALKLQFRLWEEEKITGGKVQWVGRVGDDLCSWKLDHCHDAGSRSSCATCLDVCAECFPSFISHCHSRLYHSPSVLVEHIPYTWCLQCQKPINIDLTLLWTCHAFYSRLNHS